MSSKITLELLYYEINARNRKHSQSLRITKVEKLCLIYLGWCEMNGIRLTLKMLIEKKFDVACQKLIRFELVNFSFEPVGKGRLFFYEIVHIVCLFWEKTKVHINYEGLEVDIKEVKKIIR